MQDLNDKGNVPTDEPSAEQVIATTTTVETATLVLPDDILRRGDEFVLQTTSEIAAATTDAITPHERSGHDDAVIQIEGVGDLDGLLEMVPGIEEDEFATLLHTHRNDDDDEDNTTLLSTLFHNDEETPLLGDDDNLNHSGNNPSRLFQSSERQ